ncbi:MULTISPECIES: thioredoxin family protein [Chroococcidiopsis]|nr:MULTISPECIES: thioredoxin domain-containing protein [Chroococcidiopsis]
MLARNAEQKLFMILEQHIKLEELISSSESPVLAVFSAPGCGPSRLLDAVLADAISHLPQKPQIVRIDSEQNSALSDRYQVHALPTLLIFKNGQLIGRIEEERIEDLLPAAHLLQRLQAIL